MTVGQKNSTQLTRANSVTDGEMKMDPKLTMLFLLIGAIISLSHLGDERVAKIKKLWRNLQEL